VSELLLLGALDAEEDVGHGGHRHGGGVVRAGRRGARGGGGRPWWWDEAILLVDDEDNDQAPVDQDERNKRRTLVRVGDGPLVPFADLRPYILTTVPTDPEGLAGLYRYYLTAFDQLAASARSPLHPIASLSAFYAFQAARKAITESWASPDRGRRVAAVQLLAALTGYWNARFVDANGAIKWDLVGAEVTAQSWARSVDAAAEAGHIVQEAGKALAEKIDQAASEAGSLVKTLVYAAVILAAAATGVYAYTRLKT
jgi:hypothetical protein